MDVDTPSGTNSGASKKRFEVKKVTFRPVLRSERLPAADDPRRLLTTKPARKCVERVGRRPAELAVAPELAVA